MTCLRHFFANAADTKVFPLACIAANCHVLISIPTMKKFLPLRPFYRLLEAAFLVYVTKHAEELKYCQTPACMQIYRATPAPIALACPSCFSSVCSSCHNEAHEFLSCAEFKAQQNPAQEHERLNDEWMQRQGVKKCPSCTAPIEKIDGCNHISCTCVLDFC
jgi:hypothetical protein